MLRRFALRSVVRQCEGRVSETHPAVFVNVAKSSWRGSLRVLVGRNAIKRSIAIGASVGAVSYAISPSLYIRPAIGCNEHNPKGAGTALDTDENELKNLPRWHLLRRAVWLLWSFSLVIILAPVAALSFPFREGYYYLLVYNAICYSRSAALAKWSQWASVRWDLLPATLCMLLGQLQASAPTHAYEHTLKELESAGIRVHRPEAEKAHGVPVSRPIGTPGEAAITLDLIESLPRASGSIAQVHFATHEGKSVVVKVRHPNVEKDMLQDFWLMRNAATVIHDWVPGLRWLNAPATVSQFEAAMSGQCDLSQEATNLDKFNTNFERKAAWTSFPKAIYGTPAVLIESFEEGVLMSDFVRSWRENPPLPEESRAEAHFVIQRGEDAYLQMLLVDNFMHADLHPGNILFRKSGPAGKPQIIIIDAGMAAYLTPSERTNFIGMLQALGDGDGSALAERILCFSQRNHCRESTTAFTADVKTLCAERCKGYGTGLDVGEVVRHLLQLLYKHGKGIDGNYATLIANMLCLEGMARDLEPKFNVLDVAYPLLRAHQLLGDDSFQRVFSTAQWVLPLFLWDFSYRVGLYAALNGAYMKRYQI